MATAEPPPDTDTPIMGPTLAPIRGARTFVIEP
jgi:hypothetical protein